MTDIHSHLIYNVDDGSRSIDESIELIKKLNEVGFNNIIITPHYIEGTEYCSNNDEKLEKINTLKKALKENNIKVNLYLGNEIFINDHIIDAINDGKAYTLNGTKYLLFELPFNNQILNLTDIIYEIKLHGYIPILAHPERYIYFQKDYSLVDSLHDEGLLFQSNYASILGYYGIGSFKLLKYMIKKQYVDYLGTDLHHISNTFVIDNFLKIENKFKRIAGEEYYKKIIKNADNILKKI